MGLPGFEQVLALPFDGRVGLFAAGGRGLCLVGTFVAQVLRACPLVGRLLGFVAATLQVGDLFATGGSGVAQVLLCRCQRRWRQGGRLAVGQRLAP
ncbi:histidyl-tRNA synthetase [Xanthomonas arboricola pv. pruni str. MAFF 311562]|uniref:Histidyl-tRNA synthetase n=1 Tax=Xanthomonas arboricola pv. pruni str. MAFF 311562 TaxID=1414836 RepID=W4RWF7_9XANT|nr:histidyl-tRNA synthetase [Xanthomonas arboricola pv. pruni str. MAFF 311562]